MKKILILIIFSITSFFLISCNIKKYNVGILIYEETDTFMAEYLKEIINNFDERISYSVSYSNKSQAEQNRQFNYYLDQSYDLLIINAVDRQASDVLIEKAKDKNIALVFINREPTANLDTFSRSYYVGANSTNMGELQADMIYDAFLKNKILDTNNDGIIQTYLLKGEQGHQDSENRTTKVIERLNDLGFNFEIVEISIANWDRNQAYNETEKAFNKNGLPELIISNNDDMALGALDYLKDNSLRIIPLFGVDATSLGIEAFNKDDLLGTIVNDYKNQALIISYIINFELFNTKISDFDYTKNFHYVNGYIYK